MSSERYQRGEKTLYSIHGHIGEEVMAKLGDIAPDFAKMTIEFPYGDIYARGTLSPKERQIAIISSLVTQGNFSATLKAHIQAALNVGCSREEVVELMMQMSVYAGFPAAISAIMVTKEVFVELDQKSA